MDKLVSTIMQKNVIVVGGDDTVDKVERVFRIHKRSYAAVLEEDGGFYGLITAANLFGFQMAASRSNGALARDLCTHKVASISPTVGVKQATEVVLRKQAEQLVVMEGGRVLGVVSPQQLLRELLVELDPSYLGVTDERGFFAGLI